MCRLQTRSQALHGRMWLRRLFLAIETPERLGWRQESDTEELEHLRAGEDARARAALPSLAALHL